MPGLAIAAAFDGQTVFLEGFGQRQPGQPEMVDADTAFQIASLSKPVAATIMAALVSEGIVGRDKRIADLHPAFQLHDPYPTSQVTVRDFLDHRNGLGTLDRLDHGRSGP